MKKIDTVQDVPLWDPELIGKATKIWFHYTAPKEAAR